MKAKPLFTIIGGGIAGLTTAIALTRQNLSVVLFESAPEIRSLGAGIALAANAIQAFQRMGIANEIVSAGRQLDAFTILDEQGRIITRTDSRAVSRKYGIDNFTIHRAELHRLLLAQLDPATLHTGKRAIEIEQKSDGVTISFDDGTYHHTDYLLVADGIHSHIRQQLLPNSSPRYAGYTCWRSVVHWPGNTLKEATETWGASGRVGVVPLVNDQIYWFACVNAPARDKAMAQRTPQTLANHFNTYHAPIVDVLAKTSPDALLWNDIIDLKPINRYAFGRVLLLGDAAHATTPNMGQGACQAIEDGVVLADVLRKNPSIENAFVEFEHRRLSRTHYITNNSRTIGKVAQLTNPLLISLRNGLFRSLPKSLNERQLEKLYHVDF